MDLTVVAVMRGWKQCSRTAGRRRLKIGGDRVHGLLFVSAMRIAAHRQIGPDVGM